jgi:hypothetical protein
VIKSPRVLEALEDADRRSTSRSLTYYQALDIFLALWEEARLLNPHIGANWREDVQCDIEVARTLKFRQLSRGFVSTDSTNRLSRYGP